MKHNADVVFGKFAVHFDYLVALLDCGKVGRERVFGVGDAVASVRLEFEFGHFDTSVVFIIKIIQSFREKVKPFDKKRAGKNAGSLIISVGINQRA